MAKKKNTVTTINTMVRSVTYKPIGSKNIKYLKKFFKLFKSKIKNETPTKKKV